MATCLPHEEISFSGVPIESYSLNLYCRVTVFTNALKLCPANAALENKHFLVGPGYPATGRMLLRFSSVIGLTVREKKKNSKQTKKKSRGKKKALQLVFYSVWVFCWGFSNLQTYKRITKNKEENKNPSVL